MVKKFDQTTGYARRWTWWLYPRGLFGTWWTWWLYRRGLFGTCENRDTKPTTGISQNGSSSPGVSHVIVVQSMKCQPFLPTRIVKFPFVWPVRTFASAGVTSSFLHSFDHVDESRLSMTSPGCYFFYIRFCQRHVSVRVFGSWSFSATITSARMLLLPSPSMTSSASFFRSRLFLAIIGCRLGRTARCQYNMECC